MKLVVYCSRKFNAAVEKWRVLFTEYSYEDLFGNKDSAGGTPRHMNVVSYRLVFRNILGEIEKIDCALIDIQVSLDRDTG